MTRFTNPLKGMLAAGVVAAAGLAAPVAAQSVTTSITMNDGVVEGYTVRVIDGTTYKVTFDGDGPTAAYADGNEVKFKFDEGVVYIDDDGETIEFEMPKVGAQGIGVGREMRLGLLRPDAPRVPRLPAVPGEPGANFFGVTSTPKTMIGLTQRPLDDQLREHLDLEEGVGTMILSVVEGLPADEAGLQQGDVLISVNGREVTGARVLTNEMSDLEPGDELDVVVLRKGLPETLTIKVAKFDAEKLYGERFPGGAPVAEGHNNVFRFDIDADDFDFDFDEFEELIRDELAEVQELAPEQREELDRAMAEARKQIAEAMKQANQIRGLQWDGDLDLLLRPKDKERAIVIERQAQRERIESERQKLEAEAEKLRARNRELESRLESLESRLDRLIDLLEDEDRE
jgi:hypothetical protein